MKYVSQVARDLGISYDDIVKIFIDAGYTKEDAEEFCCNKWDDMKDILLFDDEECFVKLAKLFGLDRDAYKWQESSNTGKRIISDKKLSRIIESIGFRLLEADKSRFIKPLYSQYRSLSPFELDEMLDFFKKHNEVKVDWNQKDKENLFLDLINIMNDSIKKSEEKQEEKKFYRQVDAKELLSNHPEFVLIPELENEEWVFACPISWKGAKFADSTECGGTGAKWCIGYEKDSYYWKQYTDEGFSFIFALRKDFKTHSRKNDIKYMIQILPNKGFNVWNQIDKNIIKNNKDKLESLFNVESETLITIGKEYFDSNLRDGFGYEINGDTLIVTDNDFVAPKRKQFSEVIISDGVTSIGEYVFEDYNNIRSVTIPNSVTKIGRGAFYCCRGLTSVMIPDSVTIIDDATFLYCSGLTSVAIPNSITSIGNYAFDDCDRLTSVIIPDGVMSIGSGAFIDCSSLTSVTIGNDMTSIGDYAFKDCSNLTTLTIKAQVPPQLSSDTFKECHSLESIFVPKESVEDYKSAEVWRKYSDIIKGI